MGQTMTGFRVIAGPEDLGEGLAALIEIEPRFAGIAGRCGLPALRLSDPGLAGLLRIVTDQMISLKAGEAIWSRLSAAFDPGDPHAILRRRQATLVRLGLSGHKARSFHAAARAILDGSLCLDRLRSLPDEDVLAQLTALHGIGRWTAEIYLLSCLGRADAWPAGDVALQAAAQDAFGLAARPGEAELRQMAEPWRPWRSVAARLLWSHYRSVKGLPQAED
jgi:DNA-3-methyladenine glycosylase II